MSLSGWLKCLASRRREVSSCQRRTSKFALVKLKEPRGFRFRRNDGKEKVDFDSTPTESLGLRAEGMFNLPRNYSFA
jgi:hypothetical protein